MDRRITIKAEEETMDKEILEQLLLQTPDKIHYYETELLNISQNQIEVSVRKDKIETHFKSDIAMNMSLKNPEQRKAALELQLRDHADYHDTVNILKELDLRIQKNQIELGLQRSMLRSYLAIAEMMK